MEPSLVDRGIQRKQSGDLAGAIECYEQAIAAGREVARAWYSKGVVCMEQGDDEQALECFARALELEPDYVKAWVNTAALHLRRRANEDALACAERALALAPRDELALLNRALALQALGRSREALAAIRAAVAADSDNAEAWALRGDFEAAAGDIAAQRSFDRALTLDPDNVRALTGKGFMADALGKPADGLAYLDRALELAPDHHQALKTKGCALLHLRRADEALPLLEHAHRVAPEYAEKFENAYNLACVHAQLGAVADALEWLAAAISAAPFDLREHIRSDGDLAPLRGSPRFAELVG